MMNVLLDTNVVLRFLLNDHEHSKKALTMIEGAEDGRWTLRVSAAIIAECVYVLNGPVYKRPRTMVHTTLRDFLFLDGIECSEHDIVLEALRLFDDHNVDFVDSYVAAQAKMSSTPLSVATFDTDFDDMGVSLFQI